MVIDSKGTYLYVVNSYSSDISSVRYWRPEGKRRRLKAGNNPVSIAMTPDGSEVYVSSRRSLPVEHMTSPITEMTVSVPRYQRVSDRKMWKDAYIMENVKVTPSGDMAISTLIRPKNLIPMVQIERGWMMTHGIGIVETERKWEDGPVAADEPNAYSPDPLILWSYHPMEKEPTYRIPETTPFRSSTWTRSGHCWNESTDEQLETYANHLGISSRYMVARISVGANPKGMVLSPDGQLLYVAETTER